MSPLVRSVLAVLAGLMAAFLAIMVVQQVSAMLYPWPAGADPKDPAVLKAFISTLPPGAFLIVLLGYLLGALSGGYLAARLAPSRRAVHAGIIAVLLLAASIMNLMAIPHPTWFMGANLVIVTAAPLLAARLAEPRAIAAQGEV